MFYSSWSVRLPQTCLCQHVCLQLCVPSVILASFHSEGTLPYASVWLNKAVRLEYMDEEIIRRSLAEILSGPVAFCVSGEDVACSEHLHWFCEFGLLMDWFGCLWERLAGDCRELKCFTKLFTMSAVQVIVLPPQLMRLTDLLTALPRVLIWADIDVGFWEISHTPQHNTGSWPFSSFCWLPCRGTCTCPSLLVLLTSYGSFYSSS